MFWVKNTNQMAMYSAGLLADKEQILTISTLKPEGIL
jgi:hypothetical protein